MDELDIEVVLKKHSTVRKTDIISMCNLYLSSNGIKPGTTITNFNDVNNRILSDDVERIHIGETKTVTNFNLCIEISKVQINWFVYKLDDFGPQLEKCEDETGGEMNLSTHWTLPSQEMVNLWENLIYDSDIKENLLRYAHTMMEFSDRGVDSNIISCNRVILLHGPPGTGKTSLCKALAHKLSIRMQSRFKQAVLIEINSHSLFSKYFSESGKLVTKMFTKVSEIVEEPDRLVCVLIDEIESLAHARQQCMSGNEPSDSIRVVNAVLTQIDQIKQSPNVLMLSTSNITEAIDIAFIDRADIKQYLGLPSEHAVYQIYHTCIQELLKTGIVQSKVAPKKRNVVKPLRFEDFDDDEVYEATKSLVQLSEKSVGLSGRALRKIPFVAQALFLKSTGLKLEQFFTAMDKAVQYEIEQRKHFSNADSKKK